MGWFFSFLGRNLWLNVHITCATLVVQSLEAIHSGSDTSAAVSHPWPWSWPLAHHQMHFLRPCTCGHSRHSFSLRNPQWKHFWVITSPRYCSGLCVGLRIPTLLGNIFSGNLALVVSSHYLTTVFRKLLGLRNINVFTIVLNSDIAVLHSH